MVLPALIDSAFELGIRPNPRHERIAMNLERRRSVLNDTLVEDNRFHACVDEALGVRNSQRAQLRVMTSRESGDFTHDRSPFEFS
jgi:hypothetical protein